MTTETERLMPCDPFFITGPALISFSGGRTSAYMLWRILQAHGGVLPSDVHVTFANTGKEREETLRFVHDCATNWNVRVRWLEWRSRLKRVPLVERFEEVGFNSAARNGEPFEALIRSKGITPNGLMRFCTEELKVQTMTNFAESIGWQEGSYGEIVGIRADEMLRYFKLKEKNEKRGRDVRAPLVKAKIGKRDVMAFWAEQPFDLGLLPGEGNCDLCFLKGKNLLKSLIRQSPASALWWDRIEQTIGKGNFVTEHSYADLVHEVAASPIFALEPGDEEFDAECGLWCGGEAA